MKKISLSLTFALLVIVHILPAQSIRTGLFENTLDVGDPAIPGETIYNATSQTYTLTGSGTNMWFDKDEFHYACKKLKGDFIVRARMTFIDEGVDPHRKTGWSVRPSLDGNGRHISAEVHGDGLISLQVRMETGGQTETFDSEDKMPDVVQLERRGDTFIMSTAKFGSAFQTVTRDLELPDEVYVGLFICAHNPEVKETATFSDVRIVKPAPEGLVPYREYLGSNLEIMEVATGHRKIIYQVNNSIQAPNWTPDGRTLIFNSEGMIYTFDLATREVTMLNTGLVKGNNNDHVLTFDGETLGISGNRSEGGGSVIYYLPATGSDQPIQITEESPSYLHGWSPGGKEVIYTARRNDVYNLYKSAINGGKEIQLTDTPGLDDGSEYSPDGEYIYFNSDRTGTMQLWRMKPNGKQLKQLTFDEYNDWFPHVSPDGKNIVFISFLPEVNSDDHPFYKQVYLRTIPADGGEPKVIGYLYGGQGTINVSSWSPDGKHIAFVSNTIME